MTSVSVTRFVNVLTIGGRVLYTSSSWISSPFRSSFIVPERTPPDESVTPAGSDPIKLNALYPATPPAIVIGFENSPGFKLTRCANTSPRTSESGSGTGMYAFSP